MVQIVWIRIFKNLTCHGCVDYNENVFFGGGIIQYEKLLPEREKVIEKS